MVKPIIIGLVAALAAVPANAQTARDFAAACLETRNMRLDDGQPPTPGQALCLGAFETFHWFSSIGELQGKARFCIPPDNTTQDVIQAFVDFALKHRDLLDKRAQFVMELAMHDR